MKKLLGMLVALIALLLAVSAGAEECTHDYEVVKPYNETMHQFVCLLCDAFCSYQEHSVNCTEKDAPCRECHETEVVIGFYTHPDSYYVDLGNQHQYVCDDCGEVWEPGYHMEVCTEPGICYICGVEGSFDSMIDHETPIYISNDVYCYMKCDACGYSEPVDSLHSATCDAPTICYRCGKEDVTSVDIYHTAGEYIDLGDMHQEQCSGCGHKWDAAPHQIACNDVTNTCSVCKITNLTTGVKEHPDEYVEEDIGTLHQTSCGACGEVLWAYPHYIGCNEEFPAICQGCGFEIGADAEPVRIHSNTYENLGEIHRKKCNNCGSQTDEEHVVRCSAPNDCILCDSVSAVVAEEKIQHPHYADSITVAEENHSYPCIQCEEIITRPHTYDENNACTECGYVCATERPGDADNNDKVTIDDAVAVLQKLANDSLYINEPNADVNADGAVDTQDLLLLMQYAAGWDVTLK